MDASVYVYLGKIAAIWFLGFCIGLAARSIRQFWEKI